MSAIIHRYAHDKQTTAHTWLVVPALVLALAMSKVLDIWRAPWWADTPSSLGFLGGLMWFFNKWGWHAFRWWHHVPDLNGTYDLVILSSIDKHKKPIEGTLTIAQEWTRILVTVKTATSSSSSIGAWLSDDPTQGAVLTYVFCNEPAPAAKDDLHAHTGTATIIFARDGTATGRYYNDRGRETFGSMTLTKRAPETKSSASNRSSASVVPAPTTASAASKPPDAGAT